MVYERPSFLGHCLALLASSTVFLLCDPTDAFIPALSPRSTTTPIRSILAEPILDRLATTTRRHASLERIKALSATVVPDVHQSAPRNETSSSSTASSGLPSKDNKTDNNKKERQYFADDYLFNDALNNLAKLAGDPKQPIIRRAVACEEMWKDFCSSPDEHWKPDTVSFNIVLKAWGRAGHVLEIQHTEHATPKHLLDPDVHIFSSKDCAQHAMDLLDEQEKLYDEQDDKSSTTVACPDTASFNSVMEAWAKTRTREALSKVQALMKRLLKRELQPDRISFSALMEAHAYAEEEDRVKEVQKIWSHMESHDDPKVHPNARSMIALLRVYSRAATDIHFKEGADKELLRQLGDQTMSCLEKQEQRYAESQDAEDAPGIHEYVAAMDVLAKLGTQDAAHWTESLWQKLETLGIRKNAYAYAAVITAWSRVTPVMPEATQRVADLLDEFWQGDAGRSNTRPFVAALRGFCRSNYPLAAQPNKAIVALDWVKRLREASKDIRGLRPNRALYHAAIDCCKTVVNSAELHSALLKDGSTTQSQTTALKIAFALFQAMIADKVTPDSETYLKLMRCAQAMLPTGGELDKVAEGVFIKAKHAGLADKKLVRCLRETVTSSYWDNFVITEHLDDGRRRIDWSKIPRDWTKNVR